MRTANFPCIPFLLSKSGVYTDPLHNQLYIAGVAGHGMYNYKDREIWALWNRHGGKLAAGAHKYTLNVMLEENNFKLFDRRTAEYLKALKEYNDFNRDGMAMRQVGPKEWKTKDGWRVTHNHHVNRFVLHDSNGAYKGGVDTLHAFEQFEFFNERPSKVCRFSKPVAFRPEHFNKGDVVELEMNKHIPSHDGLPMVLTIGDIFSSGFGSYTVMSEESFRDIDDIEYMQRKHVTFDLRFVNRIVKKSTDKSMLDYQSPVIMGSSMRTEPNCLHQQTIDIAAEKFGQNFVKKYTLFDINCFGCPDFGMIFGKGQVKHFQTTNRDKLFKRLKAMGLVRTVRAPDDMAYFSDFKNMRDWHFVDTKATRKFLKKNPHWMFNNSKFVNMAEKLRTLETYIATDFQKFEL